LDIKSKKRSSYIICSRSEKNRGNGCDLMNDYETARQKLEELAHYYNENIGRRNEATTRLHLIDRLFFECLAWSRDDCIAEESHEGMYTDYTFSTTRRVLIVEAKREGTYFQLPVGVRQREYAIPSLCRDYDDLGVAIKQASGYCQARGVPVGAVCNGHQVVAFVATRSDGTPPLQGRALVFPSLNEMLAGFLDLWNELSRPGLTAAHLEARLLGRAPSPVPAKLSAGILGYPGMKDRNPFQTDLQIVSELVLEDLARGQELEDDFLRECYCKSGALSQYALISKDILSTRYSSLFAGEQGKPTLVPAATKKGISPDLVADGLSRRPILLIGDVGVGKTTFIRHLVKIDAADIFDDALTIYLDLGTQGALTSHLKEFVLEEFTRQLCTRDGVDIEERNFVRAVYHLDLERFRSGIYSDLKDADPVAFARKEIEFLESKVDKADVHLQASVTHVAKGRQKQVVVFIDNADQREYEVQQQAFLIAQELAATWPATIFVALRPETFYRSLRTGALSGYHPRAFTISPPRVDHVINKRLAFGLRLASGEVPITSLPEGTKAKFHNLATIINAFQGSLEYSSDLMEAIDNISAGNVRQALDLVKSFFGSGHVDTQKIIRIRAESGNYFVPIHEFLRAVIYGDNQHFDPTRSPVTNLFDISSNDPKEHFILPLTLGVVISLSGNATTDGYVDVRYLYGVLQNYGYTPQQIDFALLRGLARRLIESGKAEDRATPTAIPQAVRVTTSGAYHVQRLIRMFSFVDAVVVDTPILNKDSRARIKDVSDVGDRLERAEFFLTYLDAQWELSGIHSEAFDWKSVSQELLENIVRIRGRL